MHEPFISIAKPFNLPDPGDGDGSCMGSSDEPPLGVCGLKGGSSKNPES